MLPFLWRTESEEFYVYYLNILRDIASFTQVPVRVDVKTSVWDGIRPQELYHVKGPAPTWRTPGRCSDGGRLVVLDESWWTQWREITLPYS